MKARHYNRSSGSEDHHDANVAELHWDDGRVVQISGAEKADFRGKHVLIRVWPENGTAEYGGGNLTSFSIILRPKGKDWIIESMHVDRDVSRFNEK